MDEHVITWLHYFHLKTNKLFICSRPIQYIYTVLMKVLNIAWQARDLLSLVFYRMN